MGIMVYSLLWAMQDLLHRQYFEQTGVLAVLVKGLAKATPIPGTHAENPIPQKEGIYLKL